MSLKLINEIKQLNKDQREKEIIIAKKELFDLRFKKATRQPFRSHFFMKTKYKLRILLMFHQNKKDLRKTGHNFHVKK
jgi:large subunit ribosomal protein L29